MSALPPEADMGGGLCVSALGQKQTCAVQQTTPYSITSSARASKDWGTDKAERLCCFQVNGEFVLVRGLHRQIRRFFAFEDAVDVGSRASVLVSKIRPIGHQSAGSDIRTLNVNRGQLVAGGRCDDQIAVDRRYRVRRHDHSSI